MFFCSEQHTLLICACLFCLLCHNRYRAHGIFLLYPYYHLVIAVRDSLIFSFRRFFSYKIVGFKKKSTVFSCRHERTDGLFCKILGTARLCSWLTSKYGFFLLSYTSTDIPTDSNRKQKEGAGGGGEPASKTCACQHHRYVQVGYLHKKQTKEINSAVSSPRVLRRTGQNITLKTTAVIPPVLVPGSRYLATGNWHNTV